jgi:hypothetical protein
VTTIGNYAFSGCSSLTSIKIPDGVESIGEGILSGCTNLESMTLPFKSTMFNVSDHTFDRSSYLFEPIDDGSDGTLDYGNDAVPSSLKTVVITSGKLFYYAFFRCKSLTRVTLLDGVSRVSGFAGCTKLKSITISDGPTSIGSEAFDYCISLENITIPDSVTSIGEGAFRDCNSLTSINYNGTKEQWSQLTKQPEWKEESMTITVHCSDGDIIE